MKKLIFWATLAGLAVAAAKKYNINSMEDLKKLVFSKLDFFTCKC